MQLRDDAIAGSGVGCLAQVNQMVATAMTVIFSAQNGRIGANQDEATDTQSATMRFVAALQPGCPWLRLDQPQSVAEFEPYSCSQQSVSRSFCFFKTNLSLDEIVHGCENPYKGRPP